VRCADAGLDDRRESSLPAPHPIGDRRPCPSHFCPIEREPKCPNPWRWRRAQRNTRRRPQGRGISRRSIAGNRRTRCVAVVSPGVSERYSAPGSVATVMTTTLSRGPARHFDERRPSSPPAGKAK
jgi:hypothetical protein